MRGLDSRGTFSGLDLGIISEVLGLMVAVSGEVLK